MIESKLDPGRGPVVDDPDLPRHARGRRRARRRRPLGPRPRDARLPRQPRRRRRSPASRSRCSASTACPRPASACASSRTSAAPASWPPSARRGSRPSRWRAGSGKRVSLEDIFARGIQELNLVLKSDVAGSLEAIEDEIAKLPQDEVSVNVDPPRRRRRDRVRRDARRRLRRRDPRASTSARSATPARWPSARASRSATTR